MTDFVAFIQWHINCSSHHSNCHGFRCPPFFEVGLGGLIQFPNFCLINEAKVTKKIADKRKKQNEHTKEVSCKKFLGNPDRFDQIL